MNLLNDRKLNEAKYILENYRYFLDSYVSDIFCKGHFNLLPESWINTFSNYDFCDIYEFLNVDSKCFKKCMPLSLLAFRSICLNFLSESLKHSVITNEFKKSEYSNLTTKKEHEIQLISELIMNNCRQLSIDKIIDIGGGQGHLARFLSFEYNFKVINLEANYNNTIKAKEIDIKFLKRNKTYKTNNLPLHKSIYLTEDINELEWDYLIDENVCDYMLNGLHVCGDLPWVMMNKFIQSENCRILSLVSCCYHKAVKYLPPLSEKCKIDFNLTYSILEGACYFYDDYLSKLKDLTKSIILPASFESQVFRAILQEICMKRSISESTISKIHIKYKHIPENLIGIERFKFYLRPLLNEFENINYDLNHEEINLFCKRYSHDWYQVIIFNCLRLLLGPVIEYYLLQDRMWFIKEKGFSAEIFTLFDSKISPRNSILVAYK